MTRDISTEINTSIQQQAFSYGIMVFLDFDADPAYLWTGTGNITWDGQTWLGLGGLGSLSGVADSVETMDSRTVATLSRIPIDGLPDFVDKVTTGTPVGRDFIMYFVIIDPDTGQPDGEPSIINFGYMDKPEITDGDTGTVSIDLVGDGARFSRVFGYRYSDDHQKTIFPGDKGFEFVANPVKDINWGSADKTSYSTGSSDNGQGFGNNNIKHE